MNQLQQALNKMIEAGPQSNPALNTVIHAYAKYHAVLVIVGGLLVVLLAWLSIRFWAGFRRVPKTNDSKWNFEKKVYFSFGTLSCVVALLMSLIVAANATNTFYPLHGFSLVAGSFEMTRGEPYKDELRYAFMEWIKSGSESLPLILQQKVDGRIEFHSTKAIVCGVLLILVVALSVILWNALIRRSKGNDSKWGLKEAAFFISGIATVALSLLLMVFVVANMQGAFAPLAAFLVGLLS